SLDEESPARTIDKFLLAFGFPMARDTQRSENVRHQGGCLPGIGGVRLPKLGMHPLLLHAELGPEHEKYLDETDEPSPRGERDRGAKKAGQNAGVDGVANHGIGASGNQLVVLLNGYGAAPVPAEVLARPDGEEKAANGNSGSNPKGPEARRPELAVE